MSDPQEVATPSDPHSAEAEEREAWAAFVAGHASRDAEVAELKAKIAELHPEDVEWDHASWGYKEASIGCPTCRTDGPCLTRQAILGSATPPVEGVSDGDQRAFVTEYIEALSRSAP